MWLPDLNMLASNVICFFENRPFAQVVLAVELCLVIIFLGVFLHLFVNDGRHLHCKVLLLLVLNVDWMSLSEKTHDLGGIFARKNHTVKCRHQQGGVVLRLLFVELCHLVVELVSLRIALSQKFKAQLMLF